MVCGNRVTVLSVITGMASHLGASEHSVVRARCKAGEPSIMGVPEGAQLSCAMVCQSCMPARQPDCQPAVLACRPALVYCHHSAAAFALWMCKAAMDTSCEDHNTFLRRWQLYLGGTYSGHQALRM